METNIYNKPNNNNMIKKLFTSLLFLIMLMSSVNAVTIEDNQLTIAGDLLNYQTGNTYYDVVAGSGNFETLGVSVGDLKSEFRNFNYDLYYTIVTNSNNVILNVTTLSNNPLAPLNSSTAIYNQYILETAGTHKLKFSPTYKGESVSILLGISDSDVIEIGQSQRLERGISLVGEQFIGYFSELVKINLNIWKLAYYIIIGGIIISVVMGFILIGYKIYTWTKKNPFASDSSKRKSFR